VSLVVRRLAAGELVGAVPLLEPEGWTLSRAELGRVHALGGAVGAFEGKRMIGFLTWLDTPPYRWIGNVAVDASARGRGVGAAIVAEAMRDAERTALYSVDKAVTLYARLGLAPHGQLHALRADRASPGEGHADALARGDMDGIVALDARVTGMERGGLLRALAAEYPTRVIQRDGRVVAFGIAKTYSDVTEVGPVVAEDPLDAWRVVDALLRDTHGPHDVAVHAPVPPGWAARGFTPNFRAVPMFTGGAPRWDLTRYMAASGLEKG